MERETKEEERNLFRGVDVRCMVMAIDIGGQIVNRWRQCRGLGLRSSCWVLQYVQLVRRALKYCIKIPLETLEMVCEELGDWGHGLNMNRTACSAFMLQVEAEGVLIR